MSFSVWISLSALVVSITSLIYSIRNGLLKENSSFLEKRNLLRLNVHEATMEVIFLIESIRIRASNEQELRIMEDLVDTAKGMTSVYRSLKSKIEIPFPYSPTKFTNEFDYLLAELKEFNLILSLAKAEFEKGNIDQLEMSVKGLKARMLGSKFYEEKTSDID